MLAKPGKKRMYLFYEHLKDASGTVLSTDVVASSYTSGKGLDWRGKDKDMFNVILALFKEVPLKQRAFNEPTKMWTFLDGTGVELLFKIETAFKAVGFRGIEFEEVEDLVVQLTSEGGIKKPNPKKVDPKKFYYNQAPAAKAGLTKDEIQKKLAALL